MATTISPDRFAAAVLAALRKEIAEVAEEEITAANERVRERVHAKLGEIACKLFGTYNVAMMRDELVISVRSDLADK
jgi:hypothetical protein